jgi:hypothetical protein
MAMSESSDKEPTPEDCYLKKMRGTISSYTHQERINTLFLRIKARLSELEELARDLEQSEEDWCHFLNPRAVPVDEEQKDVSRRNMRFWPQPWDFLKRQCTALLR